MLVEPGDSVHGGEDPPDGLTVLDFWRWAFANLCDDDVKGWFAEWLVGRLLGLPLTRRISWANSDHITAEGLRIEVKASAYWQSWKRLNEDGSARMVEALPESAEARIAFGGLFAGDSVLTEAGASHLKSDLYVFAFQNERDPVRWDALDLSQWEFYVLTRSQVAALGTRSVNLRRLRGLCAPMTAAEVRRRAGTLLGRLDASPCT